MSKIVIGYWKIRGLGQHIRLLMAYSGLEFEEVQYDNPDKWFKEDKLNLGFDFPNLPYLIDGDFKLTESVAIAKYIAKRSGKTELLGKNAEDTGRVNNLLGVFKDAYKEISGLFWNKDYENLKIDALEKARPKFDAIRDFVGENDFALGYLTIIDFMLAENLYYFESLYPSESKNYAFWWNIRRNLEALPEVKAYYERPTAIKGPFLPPYAAISIKATKVHLGYWDIRGLAQVSRLLLAYNGVDFEDNRYQDRSKWFDVDKKDLGLNFPNLPYLIDGDYNITETAAVQTYIIRKWGKGDLLGKNVQDYAKIESFLSIFNEITGAIRGLFFNANHATEKAGVLEKYAGKLSELEKFVGGKQWALGYITLIDFIVAEFSHYVETVFPEEFSKWTFLQTIRTNFNALPEITAYYQTPNASKGDFYPAHALIKVPRQHEA